MVPLAPSDAREQPVAANAFTFDTSKIRGELGAAASFAKQMTAIQEQAREALSFDPVAILRDASAATALTAQIADIQKQAANAFTFDVQSIVRRLAFDRLETALVDRDRTSSRGTAPV